jgi:type IV pilus assembly protein PilA
MVGAVQIHSRPSRPSRKVSAGFTLVELLVVVAIIGLLAAIAIPTMLGERGKAQNSAAQVAVRASVDAALAARDNTAGDWTAGAVTSTATAVTALTPSEPGYTYTAYAGASPAGKVPTTVYVNWVTGGGEIDFIAQSASGDWYCAKVFSGTSGVAATSTPIYTHTVAAGTAPSSAANASFACATSGW